MSIRLVLPVTLLAGAIACASNGSTPEPPPDGGGTDASSSSSSGGGGTSSGSSSGGPLADAASSGGAEGGSGGSSGGGDATATDAAGAEGGSSGVDATTETGEAGAGCEGLPLCEGFETTAAGGPPSSPLWSVVMGCNPNMQNAGVDGGGLLVGVDATQAHSGAHSLRVVGGDSCGFYAVTASPFSALGTGVVYARFFARFSGPPTPNHNGFLSMATGTDHMRLGFQGNMVVWNDQAVDATLPDIDTQGEAQSAATTPNTWDCFEFSVDPASGAIQFWLNGKPVPGLSFTPGQASTQGVNDQWVTGGPKLPVRLANLGLGWLGLNDQYTAWFDDVALANTRVGCGTP